MADRPNKRQLKKIVKEQSALVKKDPNNAVARLKLAGALKDLGRGSDAIEHYEHVAKSYADGGKLVQAISVYKGILEIAPGDPGASQQLSALSARREAEIKAKASPSSGAADEPWGDARESAVVDQAPPSVAQVSASPSVLRLPVTGGSPSVADIRRERRRQRRRESRPSRESLSGEEMGGASLPSLFDKAAKLLPAGSPRGGHDFSSEAADAPGARDLPEEFGREPGRELMDPGDLAFAHLPSPPEFQLSRPAVVREPAETLDGDDEDEDEVTGARAPSSQEVADEAVTSPGDDGPARSMPEVVADLSAFTESDGDREGLGETTIPGADDYGDYVARAAADSAALTPSPALQLPRVTSGRRTLLGIPLPSHPDLVAVGGDQALDVVKGVFTAEEEAVWQALVSERQDDRKPKSTIEPRSVKLSEISLFSDLSESSRELLISRIVRHEEQAGAVVVREGDPGHALFVVSSGKVRVAKQVGEGRTMEVAILGPGAFFGEFALLSDRRRHATVSVVEDAVLYEVSRKVIAELTKSDPAFGKTLKEFYRKRLTATLVRSAPFFQPLSEAERESLMGRVRFRRIPENTRIITQGERGGGFYLILIGEVDVSVGGKVLATLGDGMYFGEMSLLRGGNANATVTTVRPTEIVQLAASEFYRILGNYPQLWEEVNREAQKRELAHTQVVVGMSPSHGDGDDGVVM